MRQYRCIRKHDHFLPILCTYVRCFEIKTADKQIVRVQAYNQLTDFAYSKLNKNDKVFINGYIEDNVVKVKCINIY